MKKEDLKKVEIILLSVGVIIVALINRDWLYYVICALGFIAGIRLYYQHSKHQAKTQDKSFNWWIVPSCCFGSFGSYFLRDLWHFDDLLCQGIFLLVLMSISLIIYNKTHKTAAVKN